MKRFTFLLTMLFALVFGQSAFAQIGVKVSTDDVQYEYYVKRLIDGYYITATVGTTSSQMRVTLNPATGNDKVKFIFKSGSNGGYNLYATNIIKDSNDAFVNAPITYDGSDYFLVNADLTATPAEFTLPTQAVTNGTTVLGEIGLNFKMISPASSNNWGDNTIRKRGQTGAQYYVWYVEPAAPAPMVFSGSNTLATYSTPIAVTVPEGITAYYAEGNTPTDNEISLTQITEENGGNIIPAGQGVIIQKGDNFDGTLSAAGSDGTITSALTATTSKVAVMTKGSSPSYTTSSSNITYVAGGTTSTVTESTTGSIVVANSDNIYGFGTVSGVQAFYHFSSSVVSNGNVTMPAYKAYLNTTSSSEGAIKLKFPDGSTTSINGVNVEQKNEGAIYDLSGRRVATPVKGSLYIQNGKKYIAD